MFQKAIGKMKKGRKERGKLIKKEIDIWRRKEKERHKEKEMENIKKKKVRIHEEKRKKWHEKEWKDIKRKYDLVGFMAYQPL